MEETLQCNLIPLSDRAAWNHALEGIPHAFGHTWDCCQAFSFSSLHSTYLFVSENSTSKVVCPIVEKTDFGITDIATPFGFSGFTKLGRCDGFQKVWRNFAQERGWTSGYIALHPLLEGRDCGAEEELTVQNELYFLDLSATEKELYERLSRCRKRQIRAWSARDNWLCTDDQRLKDFVLSESANFFRKHGASPIYQFSRETWLSLLHSTNVEVIGAQIDGQLVAVNVFAREGNWAEALFHISTSEGRDATTPLMWEGALLLRSRGVTSLNMGGGVQPNDSIAEAKKRFGGRVLPLRCLKQVYSPARFAELCQRSGYDPSNLGGYFPPYRQPSVK